MANDDNLDELRRGCHLSKEMSRLYESYYEERKKGQEIAKENAKLKQRLDDLENEHKKKKKTDIELMSDTEEEENPEADSNIMGALIANERKSNNELMELRKLLINHLEKATTPSSFGVKKMGELESQTFIDATKSWKDNIYVGMQKCSYWNDHIRDPHWHPFKLINIDGVLTQVIDEKDEKLKEVKEELGENVCEAVKTALIEMNEYNPSGRVAVSELWNFQKDVKASLKEVVEYIIDGWTPPTKKRSRKRKESSSASIRQSGK
ncbi:hypothetical protein CsatB_028592 [Cannabis sativa]